MAQIESNGGGKHQDEKDQDESRVYVTRSGLPLIFRLEWPFRKSTSGADYHVLHADIALGNSEGLHAPTAVNLSATLFEVMPSLEPSDIKAPAINALRKEVDKRQVEFVKSGKRVPIPFSSRHYDFKRKRWTFGKASEEEVDLLITRTVFWQSKLLGTSVWLGDPTEALYVDWPAETFIDRAVKLAATGLFTLQRQRATANPALLEQTDKFEADRQSALAELEKKHAFERGAKSG